VTKNFVRGGGGDVYKRRSCRRCSFDTFVESEAVVPFYADVYGVRLFDAPAEHYRYGFLGGLASILPTTVSVTLPGSPVVKYPPSETFTARFVSAGNVGSICRPRAG